MADRLQVVKLAQPGFDVKTATDSNLIYNSNWPTLKIYKSGKFKITDYSDTVHTIATHDLGYTPFFWYFSNFDIRGWDGVTGGLSSGKRAEFMGPINQCHIGIDDKRLVYTSQSSDPASELEIEWYIFTLDLTKNYTAPSFKVGQRSGGGGGNQVFKIAKPDKSVASHNLEDYVVHSAARSPLIHSVTSGPLPADSSAPLGFGINVYHNFGYRPMFFGFIRNFVAGVQLYIPIFTTTVDGALGFSCNNQKVQYFDFTPVVMSLVILKDPFDVDYSVSVSV